MPIGNSDANYPSGFVGTFDGNGKIVELDINISGTTYVYAGLFGYVGNDDAAGNVTNVGTTGTVTAGGSSYNYAGGVVGYNCNGTVTNCYAKGNVIATGGSNCTYVGGVVGLNWDTVANCCAEGDVTATGSGTVAVGGVVGVNSYSKVTNCYAVGAVTASGGSSRFVGGVAGDNTYGEANNCYYLAGIAGINGYGVGVENGTVPTADVAGKTAALTAEQILAASGETNDAWKEIVGTSKCALIDALNAFVYDPANAEKGYIDWKVDSRINDGCPVFTTTEVPATLVLAISQLDSENVPESFSLNLCGISVSGITCEKSEDGKAFVLKYGDEYIALDPVTRQLVPVAEQKDAALWFYNGGLYTLVNTNHTCRGGFFRAPHFVKYYLAATSYGTAYARLLFAPALAEYETLVEGDPVALECAPSTYFVGALKKFSYDFTITAPEGAVVSYEAGVVKGWGTTFTMLYKPAFVTVRVTTGTGEDAVTTVWQAKLTATGYEMSIVG